MPSARGNRFALLQYILRIVPVWVLRMPFTLIKHFLLEFVKMASIVLALKNLVHPKTK
jgi:hypothetical protein